jgi:hypothetical protein
MKFCILPIDGRVNEILGWGGNPSRQSVGNAVQLACILSDLNEILYVAY